MAFVDDVKSAWKREGLGYLIKRSPEYVKRETRRAVQAKLYNPYGILDRNQLKSVCEQNNSIWYYGTPTEFEISEPLTGITPPKSRQRLGVHTVPPSFVCELQDVRLFGKRAVSRTSDGRYILEEMGTETVLHHRVHEAFTDFSTQQSISEITWPAVGGFRDAEYDTLINLVPRHGGSHNNFINFGHWLLEDLPRLRAYTNYHQNTGRQPRILLKNDPPSWVIDTLRLLGFSTSDWIEWDGTAATVSRLVVPKLSFVHSSGWQFQPSDRRWVGQQMKSRIDLSNTGTFPTRVYLSRQGQDRRKIENYDEVIDAIHGLGFEAIRPEELSMTDQIQLFDQAEVVLGPTGSGFANGIFANETMIVPIVPSVPDVLPWHTLACEQGLPYHYLVGKRTAGSSEEKDKNSDIIVDVGELLDLLRTILE